MKVERLTLTRAQILAYRRTVGALNERLPGAGSASLRRAAWVGLQDSSPRAALLSSTPASRERNLQPGRIPRSCRFGARASARSSFRRAMQRSSHWRGFRTARKQRRSAAELADRLDAFLGGRRLRCAGRTRAWVHPNLLRYAAPTGRVRIRWDGARRPTIWTVPPPDIDPLDARLELARRYLHVFGPTTATGSGEWAGLKPPRANAAFDNLLESLTPVRTPIGHAWILTSDEPQFRAESGPPAPARLLPSGDAFWLLWSRSRAPRAGPRAPAQLWTRARVAGCGARRG